LLNISLESSKNTERTPISNEFSSVSYSKIRVSSNAVYVAFLNFTFLLLHEEQKPEVCDATEVAKNY